MSRESANKIPVIAGEIWGKEWLVETIIECHSHLFMTDSIYEKC